MVKKLLAWIISLVLLDRILKLIATAFLSEGQIYTIVPGILDATYTQNTGIAFGLFAEFGNILLFVVTLEVLTVIYILRDTQKHGSLPVALIISGALGNLYDRFVLGYVIDYLHLKPLFVFNFADFLITLGICWLLFSQFRKDTSDRKNPKEHKAASKKSK